MRTKNRWTMQLLIIASGFTCAGAFADNCSGYNSLVQMSSHTLDLGKGMTLTVFLATSTATSSDSSHNLETGECSGTALSTPDGKVSSVGYCARHDKDGDLVSYGWAHAAGAERGTWKTTGGTGKFAGKSDSGWFLDVVADGKLFVSQWGGNCQ